MSAEQHVQEVSGPTAVETKTLYTDEATVRLVAAEVVLLTALAIGTGWVLVALLLVVDFTFRASGLLPSPLALLAGRIASALGLAQKPVFLPPKRFAASIGLAFSLGILALVLTGQTIAAYVVGGVLIVCALLESLFNYCLGCQVFHWLNLLRNKLN
jgi:hypothetical protein